MDSWSSRIIVMPTTPYTSWTGRSCAESGWSSNMPAGRGETEMATVGVTGVVGAVSAVYYKMPSLSLPLGVRCPCGLHRELFVLQSKRSWVWSSGTLSWLMASSLFSHVNVLLRYTFTMVQSMQNFSDRSSRTIYYYLIHTLNDVIV